MPRKKRSKKAILSDALDNLWSKIIRVRVDNKCEVCGSIDSINAHHIIGRSNYLLRWDLRNGVSLCAKHHKFDRWQSAHLNPIWFDSWLKKYRHEDFEYLNSFETQTWDFCLTDLEELKEKLKFELLRYSD
jgi:predicted restriction endonuclease